MYNAQVGDLVRYNKYLFNKKRSIETVGLVLEIYPADPVDNFPGLVYVIQNLKPSIGMEYIPHKLVIKKLS